MAAGRGSCRNVEAPSRHRVFSSDTQHKRADNGILHPSNLLRTVCHDPRQRPDFSLVSGDAHCSRRGRLSSIQFLVCPGRLRATKHDSTVTNRWCKWNMPHSSLSRLRFSSNGSLAHWDAMERCAYTSRATSWSHLGALV